MSYKTMPYKLVEFEMSKLPETLVVPEGYSGLGIVLRIDGRPTGFAIRACAAGKAVGTDRFGFRFTQSTPLSTRSLPGVDSEHPEPISLTVVVCTRNRVQDLARCLSSLEEIRSKSTSPFDILVVDNAPSDTSTRALVSTRKNVRYVLEPRPGLDFARNRAIREANSGVLAFIDDDAVVDRGWFSGLASAVVENPDVGCFTGPILPYELETEAQILFESRGGYNRNFESMRFERSMPGKWLYPFRGIPGSGCNMAFRKDVLIHLDGFDEALDTGAPLPGGGDLDMFHRAVFAGFPLITVPQMMVFHRHRRTYAEFRRQMYTWDLGFMAYVMKTFCTSPAQRLKAVAVILTWVFRKLGKIVVRRPGPRLRNLDLTWREICGGIVGIFGEYQRSVARVEHIRRTISFSGRREIA